MKQVFIIVTLLVCTSCGNLSEEKSEKQPPEKSKVVQIQLIDSLGIVTLSLPIRYDTGFSWVHYSDCGRPCDEQKYRFQPSEHPLIKETGWIWSEPTDSVDRFTISHSMDLHFHAGDTAMNIVRHNHIKEQLMSNPKNPPIVFDTIQKIGDRYYSFIVMNSADSIQSKKVLAVTTIKTNEVKFLFELSMKHNNSLSRDFIKNSIDFLKTIRIGEQ